MLDDFRARKSNGGSVGAGAPSAGEHPAGDY
jgi:hypothetical protein